MAHLIGGLGTSHIPAIGNAIHKGLQNEPYWKPFFDGFPPIREWLAAQRPDVVVVFYNDHGLNFFLDKMPTFAVGAAAEYSNADEGWGIPTLPPIPGCPDLSWHLIRELIAKEKAAIMPDELGEIDILIATDCISEGQNLQDCDFLVNYDIHWNPVRIIQRFGRIDAVINNAGISAQALFSDVKAEDLGWYEQLMRINLWGSAWCTHAALPHLQASRGRIVAVSSLAGLVGVPGRTAYCATQRKHSSAHGFSAGRTQAG